MSPINNLLDRLGKVKGRDGKYTALCPAHDDRSPSLSITEAQEGKVLINCHSGCPAEDIVAAVGLELKDLFPESNLSPQQKQLYRKKQNTAEIEASLSHELNVLVQVVGCRVAERELTRDTTFRKQRPEWKPMPLSHWEREKLAAARIKYALGLLYE